MTREEAAAREPRLRPADGEVPADPGPDGPMSATSRRYLAAVADAIAAEEDAALAARVRRLVAEHVAWRDRCINLLPAENITSRRVLALLGSGIATRLTEGMPGDKLFPPARQNVQIDEIEAILIDRLRRLFGCRWVEWRALSNTMANLMALEAVTAPGDAILVQAIEGGGNMSCHPGGVPDVLRLASHPLPWAPLYDIDLEGARARARRHRPRVIVVGGGYFLFPLPVAALRAIADEVGARLLYDAAHVALLVACGRFQDPLAEGADFLTLGTHKIMGGPVGGVICMNEDAVAGRVINRAHPLLLQTRDQNKLAAAAHAVIEMSAFGAGYAAQVVANARALAAALEAEGLEVLGRERGYTATHQLVVITGARRSDEIERRCQAADLLLHRGRLPGEPDHPDHYSGLRVSVQEVTRRGMREPEMARIARLIARAALHAEPPERVAADAAELASQFPRVVFSFDPE